MVVADDARQDWIASLLTDGRSIRSSNRLMMALAVLKRVGRHQHHPVVLFVVDDDGMGGHDEIRLVRVDVDEPFRLCVDDDKPSPSSSIVGRRSAARQSN